MTGRCWPTRYSLVDECAVVLRESFAEPQRNRAIVNQSVDVRAIKVAALLIVRVDRDVIDDLAYAKPVASGARPRRTAFEGRRAP